MHLIRKLIDAPKRLIQKRLKSGILEGKIISIEEPEKLKNYKIATAVLPEYPEIYYDPRVLKP